MTTIELDHNPPVEQLEAALGLHTDPQSKPPTPLPTTDPSTEALVAEMLDGQVMAAAGGVAIQEAVFLELVGRFDAIDAYRHWDGIRSTAHWLSWACSQADGTAREHVRVARALRRMPTTRAAFATGELTYSKVREVTRLVDHFDTPAEDEPNTAPNQDRTNHPNHGQTQDPNHGQTQNPNHGQTQNPNHGQTQDPNEDRTKDPELVEGPIAHTTTDDTDNDDTDNDTDTDTDAPNEEGLIRLARNCTAHQLATTVSGYRAADGTSRKRRHQQRVSWLTRDNGMVLVTMVLPPEEGATVIAAIQAATDANTTPETETQTQPGTVIPDNRQPGQSTDEARTDTRNRTRVEAVCEIANHYLTSRPEDRSGEDRTLVVLEVTTTALETDTATSTADVPAGTVQAADTPEQTARPVDVPAGTHRPADVPAGTVQAAAAPDETARPTDIPAGTHRPAASDPQSQTCRVRGGAAIETSAAQRALCNSRILAIITNHHGQPLAIGRDQRLVTRAQRRTLMIRDQTCQYPGCHQTRRLQAHHRQSWLAGGPTDLDNLILLCQWHHTRTHENHLTITHCDHPDCPIGWQFTRPDATIITPLITGRHAPNPWRPLTDALGGTLPEPAREAARIRNDHNLAIYNQQQADLAQQTETIHHQYQHINCTDHPDAQRVFPPGGGAGFNLANCIDVLFGLTTPTETQAA